MMMNRAFRQLARRTTVANKRSNIHALATTTTNVAPKMEVFPTVTSTSLYHHQAPSPSSSSSQQIFGIRQQQQQRHFSTHNIHRGTVLPFNLADIGEGIKEVEIVSWNIKEGDQINEFDLVAEVKSDKANVEITSRYSGVVKKLHYAVGDTALVGNPLIDIELSADSQDAVEAEAVAALPQQQQQSSTATSTVTSTVTSSATVEQSINKVLTTPAVRRLAREHHIDLTHVAPTGPKGRLLKEDVLNFIKTGSSATTTNWPTQQVQQQQAPTSAAPSHVVSTSTTTVSAEDRVEQVKGIKKAMIKTMNAANAIPHFGLTDDVRMDKLMALRTELKRHAESQDVKLTYMPFFIKAASLALKQYPIMNSTLSADETQITYRSAHNIGIAMDTPEGLLVPIIKNVQNLSIMDIARELNRLQQLGAKGKLGQSDLTGGSFSLSNIGTIGGKYASPLLPPGNVGIGAIGKIQKTPIYERDDTVVPAQIMNISWSADHRIIDGATLARFSKAWKTYVENPNAMFLDMQ